MGSLRIPLPHRRHGGTPSGYFDWLGQVRANIVAQKNDRICLKPSFYAIEQSVWGPFLPYWGFPMGSLSISTPPRMHVGYLLLVS